MKLESLVPAALQGPGGDAVVGETVNGHGRIDSVKSCVIPLLGRP